MEEETLSNLGNIIVQAPTQSLDTQLILNEVAQKQQRLNQEKGAELDRINAEFFTTQDIRRTQSTAAENRLSTRVAGQETRETEINRALQERATQAQLANQQERQEQHEQ